MIDPKDKPSAPPAASPRSAADAPDSLRPPTDDGLEAIRPMVADLRQRLASMAAQELEVQRRESEIAQQRALLERRARDAAEQELHAARERLERRSNELDAQAVELATRRSQLDRIEARLAERERKLDLAQREHDTAARRLAERLEEERGQRAADRRVLARRIDVIRERERELERRVKLARDDIVQQRADLDDRLALIEQRSEEAEARRNDMDALEAQRRRSLDAALQREAELAAEREALERERQALSARARSYDGVRDELEEERRALAERQRELEEEFRSAREHRARAGEQGERLAGRERDLRKQGEELAARRAALEAAEARAAERWAAVTTEERSLAERGESAARRDEANDARERELARRQRELERHNDQLAALRESAELRDAETRQAALALELERAGLDRERAGFEQQFNDLASLRDRDEATLRERTQELEQRSAALLRSEQALFRGSRRWPLRAALLSLCIGIGAAVVALRLDPPRYRASAELNLTSAADPAVAARQHAARLLTPDDLESLVGEPLATRVRAARDQGRLSARSGPDGAVWLDIADDNARSAAALALEAARAYCDALNAVAAGPAQVATLADLSARRSTTHDALLRLRADADALAGSISALPPPGGREAAVADLVGHRARHAELIDALAAARTALAGAIDGTDARGIVDPQILNDAVRADAVHSEDMKELRIAAREYQGELAVGMVLLVDPLGQLRDALQATSRAVSEQRELQPPPDIAAALEPIANTLDRARLATATFAQDWERRRLDIERARGEPDVIELVRQQSEAAESVRRFSTEARLAMDEVAAIVEGVGAAGGTREIVVATLLRSELARLRESLAAVDSAAQSVDTTTNFRLDAADTRLRGLRTRLAQREAAVLEMLQSRADAEARDARGTQTEELRLRVRALEQDRDHAVLRLADAAEALRAATEREAERTVMTRQLQLLRDEAERLTSQVAALDESLAQVDRSGPRPDRAALGATATEQISGRNRVASALFALLGAAAMTFGVCALLLIQPRRPAARR
ncbi:MAG: hypothetical protein HRU75_02570 [Planctomycetia bacterium]|nr:MAG: hypothetical protein HRU75_02570 [Planctomycetia bacterium]